MDYQSIKLQLAKARTKLNEGDAAGARKVIEELAPVHGACMDGAPPAT